MYKKKLCFGDISHIWNYCFAQFFILIAVPVVITCHIAKILSHT